MNCHQTEMWILLRDSGELDVFRTRLLDRHLAKCAACRAFADALTAGRSALHAEPFSAADDGRVRALVAAARETREKHSPSALAWRPALALAALILSVGVAFWWQGRTPIPAPSLARNTPVDTPAWDVDLDDELEAIDAILLSSVDDMSPNNGAGLADEEALLREWLELNGVEI